MLEFLHHLEQIVALGFNAQEIRKIIDGQRQFPYAFTEVAAAVKSHR
jgi:hypothetical protein